MTATKLSPAGSKAKVQRVAAKKMAVHTSMRATSAGSIVSGKGRDIGAINHVLSPQNGNNPRTRANVLSFFQKTFCYFLGQPEYINEMGMVKIIHERLPTSVVETMLGEGVVWAELEKALIPRRTFTHRIKNNEPLSVEESDRAVRMARILAQAESVFGDKSKAMHWLRHSMKKFDGNTPMQLMDTDAGSRLVEEALIQIEEGFFA